VEKEIEAKELSCFIDEFLRGLTEDQRTVFIRRYWYMDQISDIRLATGFSEGKIKMMLSRTRNKLRAKLMKEGVSI
jgi:RNA polymerase sigma-70 factor (ECF subfamily)